MEVLSYLELNIKFSKMGYSESEVYCMDLSEYLELDEQTFEDFYAQKFSPELIEKYFEGFTLKTKENFIYKFDYIVETNKIVTVEVGDEFCLINLTFIDCRPRTLDEFITDCQRAGIKLKWRKQ